MLPDRINRVILFFGRVDFRKRFNGLYAECRRLGYDPYSGDVIIFIKRDKRQIRAICGDDKGLFLFSRRFEGGSLRFDFSDSKKTITVAELKMMFSGVQYTIHRKVKSWR